MFYEHLANHVLSFFFPDRCILCGKVMSNVENELYICYDCAQNIIFSDERHTCAICGCPLYENERLCSTCQTHPHTFDCAISCLTYDGSVKDAIIKYKFYHKRAYCRPFSAMMHRRVLPLHRENPFDLVLCAPLSKASYRMRGYNQAALLAGRIADKLELPFIEKAFLKIKETPKQSTLHYQERLQNLSNAFRLNIPNSKVKGKRILLIDDVITTGATADSLSKHLKRAGAHYVLILTIAATEKNRLATLTEEDIAEITF